MSFSRPQPNPQLVRACPPPPGRWNRKPLPYPGPPWSPAMHHVNFHHPHPPSPPTPPQLSSWEQQYPGHQYSPPPPPWTFEQPFEPLETGRFINNNGNGNPYYQNYSRMEYQVPWNPQLPRMPQMCPNNMGFLPPQQNTMPMCSNVHMQPNHQPLSPQMESDFNYPPVPIQSTSLVQMVQPEPERALKPNLNNGRLKSMMATSEELAILAEIQRLLGWGSIIDLEYEVEVWRTCISSALGQKRCLQF